MESEQKPEEKKESTGTIDREKIYRDPESISEQLSNLRPVNASPAHDFFDFLFDLLKTGVIVFIFALLIRYFALQPFIVDGESMMPSYLNKEYLLAEKVSYLVGQPQRGDVIVFQYPKNTSVNYIKRIVGLPNDTVKIKDNTVTIVNKDHPNGIVLDETYLPSSDLTEVADPNGMTVTLKDNEYFVLGDNREHSSDSREWGILPRANILGRAWVSIAKLGTDSSNIPSFYFKVHARVASEN